MHCRFKLKQYGLSPNKIKRIIRFPDRKEEGIAPNTIAVMQLKNKKDPKKGEIWVMYQTKVKSQKSKVKITSQKSKLAGAKTKIISVWVFPGISPKGKEIFVPDEVWGIIAGKYESET